MRVIRPFPDVKKILEGKNIGVVESFVSLGSGGILYNELKQEKCSGFISQGDVSEKDFELICKKLMSGDPGIYWL